MVTYVWNRRAHIKFFFMIISSWTFIWGGKSIFTKICNCFLQLRLNGEATLINQNNYLDSWTVLKLGK